MSALSKHDRENRDRFVGQGRVALDQPERSGNRSGNEQQDDEDLFELGEKFLPSRHWLFCAQFVAPKTFQPRSRFGFAEAELRFGS